MLLLTSPQDRHWSHWLSHGRSSSRHGNKSAGTKRSSTKSKPKPRDESSFVDALMSSSVKDEDELACSAALSQGTAGPGRCQAVMSACSEEENDGLGTAR